VIVRSVLTAFCLTIAAAFPASADDPYTITGVRIDATAGNALEAQTLAMREGQTQAARQLIDRLTLAEDRVGTGLDFSPHINDMGEMIPGLELDETIAAEMISGMEIRDEQRSATRYIARLDVSFDPRAVERTLDGYGVPFVESQSRTTLVLPIYDNAGQFILWDDTRWRSAWEEQSFANALTPMFAPPADELRQVVSARSALSLDEDVLRHLAGLYGVSRIAVLRAQDRDGLRRFGGFLVSFERGDEMAVETWGPEVVEGGWRSAARRFVQSREDAWKTDSIVRSGEEQELRLTVLYGGHHEWIALQSMVTGTSLVEDARLDAMSRDGALMTVGYRGELVQLVSELAERGAVLEEHPGIGWVVRSAP
jgi:hypothetical protein